VAIDYTNSNELLKKHRALNRYWHKQVKVKENTALSQEEKGYLLLYKKEDELAKKRKMELKRQVEADKEREKFINKMAEKEAKMHDVIGVSKVQVCSHRGVCLLEQKRP